MYKLYHEEKDIKLYEGDTKEVLPEIKDKVDFVMADFPYSTSKEKTNRFNSIHDYIDWVVYIVGLFGDICNPMSSYMCFLERKIGGHISSLADFRCAAHYRDVIIWRKLNPEPITKQISFNSSFKTAYWFLNSKHSSIQEQRELKPKVFNFLSQEKMHNVWNYTTGYNETEHPTEKPLGLTIKALEIFTKKGDLVLDPFCGSGTTAVACKQLGRRFIGIEINPDYLAMQVDRLRQEFFDF